MGTLSFSAKLLEGELDAKQEELDTKNRVIEDLSKQLTSRQLELNTLNSRQVSLSKKYAELETLFDNNYLRDTLQRFHPGFQ